VGMVAFALTKHLDERMRPPARDSVERLYRRIRPIIQDVHASRFQRREEDRAVGTTTE
jgi:hypothetical protein